MSSVELNSMILHVKDDKVEFELRVLNPGHYSLVLGEAASVIFWNEQAFLAFCSKVEEFKERVLNPQAFVTPAGSPRDPHDFASEDPHDVEIDSREPFNTEVEDDVPF